MLFQEQFVSDVQGLRLKRGASENTTAGATILLQYAATVGGVHHVDHVRHVNHVNHVRPGAR